MSGPDDDLTPWHDDPLVRALRGPGTADELAGESDFRAAFRAAQPAAQPPAQTAHPAGRGRLRLVGRRLGGGGTAVVVAVALGAGAAAAYTQNLPDPVQRAVHGVLGPVGVPAPEKPRAERSPSSPASGSASPDREQSPSEDATTDSTTDPTTDPTQSPTEKPSDEATGDPSDSPSSSPSASPTSTPTDTPSEAPTSAPPAAPAAVSGAGTSHRATPDESVAFSGTVTDAAGVAVAGQQVDLLQRQGTTWTPVATGTSDAGGLVSIPAPALTRTSVFRLGIGDQLASEPWRVVLVPTLSMASTSGSSIVVTARGGRPGDPVSLFTRRPGPDVLIARSRLAADLTTTFQAPAPRRPVTLVARLPRTRAHAPTRTSLRVVPPAPASMTASVADTTPGPGDQVTVSGTVSAGDGQALPGRTVWLMLREKGADWRRVGSAVSGDTGSVSIALGPLDASVAVRLRVGTVRSEVVQLQLQPEWSASVSPSGDGSAVLSGTARGGAAGDRVLLRTLASGGLTTVGQATLAADGSVRFVVPQPAKGRVRYRLVLDRTPAHLRAMTTVVVQAAPR